MKIIKYFLILIFSCSLSAQNLTQSEFERINSDVNEIVFSINSPDDFQELISKFNLSEADSIKLKNLFLHRDIKFSFSMQSKSHIIPFYFLTDNPNELKLTVFSLTVEPKRNREEFVRGEYHFVMNSIIKFENENLTYDNSVLITDSDLINKWFLNEYRSYLDKSRLVSGKFNYTPPPPPLPPTTLE